MALTEFEGEVIQETGGAYLIDLGCHDEDEGEEGTWIAKCMMHEVRKFQKTIKLPNGSSYEAEFINFQISDKIALEKGLI